MLSFAEVFYKVLPIFTESYGQSCLLVFQVVTSRRMADLEERKPSAEEMLIIQVFIKLANVGQGLEI
jgi:hypothetical protein